MSAVRSALHAAGALVGCLADRLQVLASGFRERQALAVEILFLRRQLALYAERGVHPRRLQPADRLRLVCLSRLLGECRKALVVVTPETLIRWHRAGFRLLWRWRSRTSGRPPIPDELQTRIAVVARDNPVWSARRIQRELWLKLGLRVAVETVRRYMPPQPPRRRGRGRGDQRWAVFVRSHAQAIVACDFFVTVTASFRVLYAFVVMEVGSRRILHINVSDHPTSAWTAQQLREAMPCDHAYRFLIHDRDSIFSRDVDATISRLGLRVLRTPVRAPKANAVVERLVGTCRRECLDWLIPLDARHLLRTLREWLQHYNRTRPHSSLGPGFPDPAEGLPVPLQPDRHRLPPGSRVTATPVLGGLHHDYRLDRAA